MLIMPLIILCVNPSACAENYYVDSQEGNNSWTGGAASWRGGHVGPKATIQACIDITREGDVITLGEGTYQGDGNRDLDINGKGITLRSENGLGNVVIDCGGRPDEFHQGLVIDDIATEVVLEGLWIINGNGPRGGGIYCNQSNVTIIHCIFYNHKTDSGGGLFSSGSTVTIDRSAFLGNYSAYSGAGIDCWQSDLTISNSLINGNLAGRYGGGISVAVNSTIEITNCTISQNRAEQHGGGIFCRHESELHLSHTILWEDQSLFDGPEIALVNRSNRPSQVSIEYCNLQGGPEEIYLEEDCELSWETGNIEQNPRFLETGRWQNGGKQENIASDLWLAGDLRLQEHSVCIDAGSADYQPALHVKEFDGYSRMVKGWVDIGAYEHQLEADWIVDDDSMHDPGPGDPAISDALEDGSSLRPFDTIQEALDMAQAGDTIIIRDGVYHGMGNHDLTVIAKALTIQSENGPQRTIIDCKRLGQGFYLDQITEDDITLEGLTITNGWAVRGGGIYSRNSSAQIKNCIIRNNQATSCGGGIYCEGDLHQASYPVISNSQILGNRANGPGGGIDIYYSNIYPTIVNNVIAGNVSYLRGGGLSVFTTNTPAIIINNTVTSNRSPDGGGIYFNASSGSQLNNCILWKNESQTHNDLHVQQFGQLFMSHVDVDYCNVESNEETISILSQSGVCWGESNLATDPCFVAPGYIHDNDTPGFIFDDFWVDGNYHLNYRSQAIDAGDNSNLEILASNGLDSGMIFNGIIDIGAFEYRGIDPDMETEVTSGYLRFSKIIVKAGKKTDSDSFSISGELDGELIAAETIGDMTVRIGPYVETLYAEGIKWSKQADKFSYKGPKEGITSAKVDLKNKTFAVAAKNVDLTGLGETMLVELALGSFYGLGKAEDDVINAGKPVPIEFMNGFENTLRVEKIKAKNAKSRDGDPIYQWTISGQITLADADMPLDDFSLRVGWGNLEDALYEGDVMENGSPLKYQYQRGKYSESTIGKACFDLENHTFEIVIEGEFRDTEKTDFHIIFENGAETVFDETVQVDLT